MKLHVYAVLVHAKGHNDARLLGVFSKREQAEKVRDQASKNKKIKGYVSVLKMTVRGEVVAPCSLYVGESFLGDCKVVLNSKHEGKICW